ncbi:MAG TPA: sulfite exporter TauE/SafE family protein [Pirellulales bacterium]|nr:sulfite exporter TauE/SafE family protein [Pirellulales bacterium]
MTPVEIVVLCIAAAVGGAINSVAGGGTLVTFPTLQAALSAAALAGTGTMTLAEAAVVANATSTVALVPGALASMWGYRGEIGPLRRWAVWLAGPSFVGGCAGALLLTVLPPETFELLVPWLILTAATLFALQPTIARWTGIGKPHAAPTPATMAGIVFFQTLVGIYGGYFGAGIGILMLSALAFMGLTDIHAMNGLKNLLGSIINGVACAVFIVMGKVDWPIALVMAGAAIAGGYVAARTARRMDRNVVRGLVITIGYVLTAYYFAHRYF